jgi:hypothetical protein
LDVQLALKQEFGSSAMGQQRKVGTVAGMSGASAFTLRDILWHRTVAMTNRYANHAVDPVRQLSDQVGGTIAAQLDGKPKARMVPLRVATGKSEY